MYATPRALTLSTPGSVSAGGAVGAAQPLASLTVATATNVTLTSTVATTGAVTQSAGTGVRTSDYSQLTFRKVRRPIYPLDLINE